MSQFPKSKITAEVFNLIRDNYISSIVYYIINSKYRKSVKLVDWLKKQVINPSEALMNIVNQVPTGKDYDEQVLFTKRWVRNHLTYMPETRGPWRMTEYWATAEEIILLMQDDCEGGATLQYVINRLKGVPSNRMLIFAGDVVGGGHCWLGYKSAKYPTLWQFLDWCYWYNDDTIDNCALYDINKQDITAYRTNTNNYIKIWFGFSEDNSYRQIRY